MDAKTGIFLSDDAKIDPQKILYILNIVYKLIKQTLSADAFLSRLQCNLGWVVCILFLFRRIDHFRKPVFFVVVFSSFFSFSKKNLPLLSLSMIHGQSYHLYFRCLKWFCFRNHLTHLVNICISEQGLGKLSFSLINAKISHFVTMLLLAPM